MPQTYSPLFSTSFLRAAWNDEYDAYVQEGRDQPFLTKLTNWAEKEFQKETGAEVGFVQTFFVEVFGYRHAGAEDKSLGFTIEPKASVKGAGQGGGTGEADLALGQFGQSDIAPTFQVLCEFKDIKSGLDSPQNRKGNRRTPVKQCADYLRFAAKELYGNEPIQPTWGIVTDMVEFRLYWAKNMPVQYQRFILSKEKDGTETGLLDESEDAIFQRFVFQKIFSVSMLLTNGGKSNLERLSQNQGHQEKELEKSFYKEYRAFREKLFTALEQHNPSFEGTKGDLVRIAQRILDRLIFILYCEDMGKQLNFPPHLLRDRLRHISSEPFYEPKSSSAWSTIKDIFQAMAKGLSIAGHNINRFNGGLFSDDKDINSLHLPTEIFCAKGQAGKLESDKSTLLFLSATYNFGTVGDTKDKVINLYTLGRIFEQSITELEIRIAEAEGKVSIGELSRRKRDGVYYTPEWVTRFIVEETIGSRLEQLKKEVGWGDTAELSNEEINSAKLAKRPNSTNETSRIFRKGTKAYEYQEGLKRYRDALREIKIVDPACGSGAFLIQALEFMLREYQRIAADLQRLSPLAVELFDDDSAIRTILSLNIFGVDINPESVELTKLALWLHTALPNRPLNNLDDNILCGNSLVGSDFYTQSNDLFTALNPDQRERVNAFDWEAKFPTIYERYDPGFDCVIGNPPYVKLQHFRQLDPEVAEYLVQVKGDMNHPVYQSTQTGNFDLYLPFIEKGVRLLNDKGHMGYIAPSVWLSLESGEGLRKFIRETRSLTRWLDFKSHQIFDEAITYTALQFYQKRPSNTVAFANAEDGGVDISNWRNLDWQIDTTALPKMGAWALLPKTERQLLDKLESKHLALSKTVQRIIVGIQTSADHIYHLERISKDKYLFQPPKPIGEKDRPEPIEVEIEDEMMKPLISGTETKRFQESKTNTYLIFPYRIKEGKATLRTEDELSADFPLCWSYLKVHETTLRLREGFSAKKIEKEKLTNRSPFDDDQWYRFGRSQNIDKQHLAKLLVPRIVTNLFCAIDKAGEFCIDNVDVGGILCQADDMYYLAGILNSRISDFIFRRISKPFQNGFWSANKQFIAPIPIPKANKGQKNEIDRISQSLEMLHTDRRNKLTLAEKRLKGCDVRKSNLTFIFPQIRNKQHWKAKNPDALKGKELTIWVNGHYDKLVEKALNRLEGYMCKGANMRALFKDGELFFSINGRIAISGVFVDEEVGEHIAAQWQYIAETTNITDKTKPKALADKLSAVAETDNPALSAQLVKLMVDISDLNRQIDTAEVELNRACYELYELTNDEVKMVEGDYN